MQLSPTIQRRKPCSFSTFRRHGSRNSFPRPIPWEATIKRIRSDGAERLIVEVRSPFQAIVGAASLIFLVWLGYLWLDHSHETRRMIGLAGAGATCLLFLAIYESGDFAFDSRTRLLKWSRRIGLVKRRGEVPFADIDRVVVETGMGGNQYYPRQRVVLVTGAGELPLTMSYEHDSMNAAVAESIRDFLGRPTGPPSSLRRRRATSMGGTSSVASGSHAM